MAIAGVLVGEENIADSRLRKFMNVLILLKSQSDLKYWLQTSGESFDLRMNAFYASLIAEMDDPRVSQSEAGAESLTPAQANVLPQLGGTTERQSFMAYLVSAFIIVALGASTATAKECLFPQNEPVRQSGKVEYLFLNTCGKPYEVGYRLDGNTLFFPRGGKHALPKADDASAEQVLRDAYGLIGERDKLIRTKF